MGEVVEFRKRQPLKKEEIAKTIRLTLEQSGYVKEGVDKALEVALGYIDVSEKVMGYEFNYSIYADLDKETAESLHRQISNEIHTFQGKVSCLILELIVRLAVETAQNHKVQ